MILKKAGTLKLTRRLSRKVLKGKTVVSYESGKSGVAIRAVSPVMENNRIVGLLMFGKLFSNDFVGNMKKLTGLESGIYMGKNKIISTYSGFDSISEENLTELRKKGSLLVRTDKDKYLYKFKALYTDRGDFWGAISLRIIEKSNEQYISYTGSILFLMIMIGFFLSLLSYLILATNINQSLEKIINGITNFNISKNGGPYRCQVKR